MHLSATLIIALIVQTISAMTFLWYAKFPESVWCHDEDDQVGFFALPECPESRPQVGLMGVGCLMLAVAGVFFPAAGLLRRQRSIYFALAFIVTPPLAVIAGVVLAQDTRLIASSIAIASVALYGLIFAERSGAGDVCGPM